MKMLFALIAVAGAAIVCLPLFAADSGCGMSKASVPAAAAATAEKAAVETANPQEMKPQTLCPVEGNPITKEVSSDYQGKRVYFCCPGCKAAFEGNPGMYMEKMMKDGVAPEAVPAAPAAK
jgi:YHS domain-containing protein